MSLRHKIIEWQGLKLTGQEWADRNGLKWPSQRHRFKKFGLNDGRSFMHKIVATKKQRESARAKPRTTGNGQWGDLSDTLKKVNFEPGTWERHLPEPAWIKGD